MTKPTPGNCSVCGLVPATLRQWAPGWGQDSLVCEGCARLHSNVRTRSIALEGAPSSPQEAAELAPGPDTPEDLVGVPGEPELVLEGDHQDDPELPEQLRADLAELDRRVAAGCVPGPGVGLADLEDLDASLAASAKSCQPAKRLGTRADVHTARTAEKAVAEDPSNAPEDLESHSAIRQETQALTGGPPADGPTPGTSMLYSITPNQGPESGPQPAQPEGVTAASGGKKGAENGDITRTGAGESDLASGGKFDQVEALTSPAPGGLARVEGAVPPSLVETILRRSGLHPGELVGQEAVDFRAAAARDAIRWSADGLCTLCGSYEVPEDRRRPAYAWPVCLRCVPPPPELEVLDVDLVGPDDPTPPMGVEVPVPFTAVHPRDLSSLATRLGVRGLRPRGWNGGRPLTLDDLLAILSGDQVDVDPGQATADAFVRLAARLTPGMLPSQPGALKDTDSPSSWWAKFDGIVAADSLVARPPSGVRMALAALSARFRLEGSDRGTGSSWWAEFDDLVLEAVLLLRGDHPTDLDQDPQGDVLPATTARAELENPAGVVELYWRGPGRLLVHRLEVRADGVLEVELSASVVELGGTSS